MTANPLDTTFRIDDDDRYSRLELIGWWEQNRIRKAKVLVVGAGALGNEVLKNLALVGWGTTYLIDFDEVQTSNLSRSVLFRARHAGMPKSSVAAEMMVDLNPDCQVFHRQGDVQIDVGLGLVRDVDLVICCVDNREARLWINRMCWKVGTPWIDGGIQEINGVAKVFQPPAGACYECAMTENDYRLIALRYSCPLLQQQDIMLGRTPTAPTIASMIGGLQVQEALKLIHQFPPSSGVAWVFNGIANRFYQTQFTRRENCLSHESYDSIEISPLGHRHTVRELFEWIVQHYQVPIERLTLALDRDFLVALLGADQKLARTIEQPLRAVTAEEAVCPDTGQPLLPQTICQISHDSPYLDRSLAWLGIPAYDIVKVSVDLEIGHDHNHFQLLLAADRESEKFSGWVVVNQPRQDSNDGD